MNYQKQLIATVLLAIATSSAQALETTIDFENQTSTGVLNNVPNLTIGDVTFDASGGDSTLFIDNLGSDLGGDFSGNYITNGFLGFSTLTFSFATPVSQFSFNLGNNQNDWELTAFDTSDMTIGDSLLINRIPPNSSNNGALFGISSTNYDISYATLVMGSGPPSPFPITDEIEFDNLKYTTAVSPVPEPSTYALMLGGLGMVAFMAYRRRKTENS